MRVAADLRLRPRGHWDRHKGDSDNDYDDDDNNNNNNRSETSLKYFGTVQSIC